MSDQSMTRFTGQGGEKRRELFFNCVSLTQYSQTQIGVGLAPRAGFKTGSPLISSKKDWLIEPLGDLEHPCPTISKEGGFGGGQIPGEDDIGAVGTALSQGGCSQPRQVPSTSSGLLSPSPASSQQNTFSKTIAECVSFHKLQLAELAASRATAENYLAQIQADSNEPLLLDTYRRVRRVIAAYKKIPEGRIAYGYYLELDLDFERWEKRWLKPYLDEEFLKERILVSADDLERVETVGSLVQKMNTSITL